MRKFFVLAGFFLGLLVPIPTSANTLEEHAVTDERGLLTIAHVIEEVTPSVVNISVVSSVSVQANPLFKDPFFRRFFNVPDGPRQQERMSAGSGVIVDADDGLILTNHHVVKDGKRIMVTLKDGRQFEAELRGSDAATDVAVLQIDADDLVAIKLGNSDRIKVGDFVVAIGNPFGIGQTVTSGIISALGRSGINIEGYEDFIQTDAPINPGNSGGALVTSDGRLVGINTAIISPAGGNVGIGFAIPVKMAQEVMQQLLEHGEVKRGRLGITIQDVTPDVAEAIDAEGLTGALVVSVEPDTPAAKAGLETGDIVTHINNRKLRNSADLRNTVGLMEIGEEFELTYVREGKSKTVTTETARLSVTVSGRSVASAALEGASISELKRGMPGYGEVDGLLVTTVATRSPAWQSGLREGDVIVAVNRTRVSDLDDLESALEEAGRVIALRVFRDGRDFLLMIRR